MQNLFFFLPNKPAFYTFPILLNKSSKLFNEYMHSKMVCLWVSLWLVGWFSIFQSFRNYLIPTYIVSILHEIMSFPSKAGDRSRGRREGSLFNSYYTEMSGKALFFSLDCPNLFQWLLHLGVGEATTPVFRLPHFTLDTYLIYLICSARRYQVPFLKIWYDSTWD